MIVKAEQIESIRTLLKLPKLQVFLSEDWSSQRDGYRERLRQHLAHALQNKIDNFNEMKKLLDLKEVPNPPGLCVSLSHCQLIGGFAQTESPYRIGFDLEQSDRVTVASIARVCTQQELKLMSDPVSLWTAKESSFKALFQVAQPDVMSKIEIIESYKYNDEILHFHFTSPEMNDKGDGCVLDLGPVKVGFAKI